MLPFLARKYLYRYLVIAVALPILARLLMFSGLAIEKRSGKPNVVSKGLKRVGAFTQRRADKSGKHTK